jgi:predicted metal-binding membrane protein
VLPPADASTALRYGLRLGVRRSACCANLAAILIVLGVMDLRVMVIVTAAITTERLLPAGERIARVIVVSTSLFLTVRAVGLE